MSLTARLSAFFLAALALVLAGFSAGIYVIVDDYLEGRERERVQAAFTALRAMAEVDHEGVEWEGAERGAHNLGPDVAWAAYSGDAALIDNSVDLATDDPLRQTPTGPPEGWLGSEALGPDRRGLRQTLRHDASNATRVAPGKHTVLVLTAAISKQPRHALLQRLGIALGGVSAAVWLLALLGGRWYCRRALRPVTAMADQAQAMRAEDDHGQLAVAPTGDELETLSRSFNGLLDRLHEALERQRRFTGDASHQLRTPLAGLLGQVEVALRRERGPDEYRQTLERVREQAEQLRRIVEMLLFLARADAEARVDDLAPLDLAPWLPEQLQRWDLHPRRRDLQMQSAGSCRVRAHGPLLGQLLDNLIDNALKYSEPGTPVTIRLERGETEARLIVEDTGVGIDAADLPRLFEPFFRAAHARAADRGGTGLGLSVARRIAEVLGGRLTAAARDGRGCRFILTLALVGST